MILRKKCCSSLVFGLALLLEAATAGAQIRTVLVSPAPGNPTASGTALLNALAGISSPSATNRWLLKIEPGIYDVGTASLQMRSWVDIEGSGMGTTTIRRTAVENSFNGTIHGADNAELRLLTVEASGNTEPGPIAMVNNATSPRLYRVRFSTTGGRIAWGVRNLFSTPVIEECEITVTGTGAANSFAYGVVFRLENFALPAGRSSILRSKITVASANTNYGLFMADGQLVTEIRDSRLNVIGGATTRGIYAERDSGWIGQENLQIRNSEINSAGGSSASYGIDIEGPAAIHFDIIGSKVWGHVSPTSYGISNSGPGAIGLQASSVTGFTHTLETAGNASIASTLLQGGSATAEGWIGCMGVWDENAVFYPQGGCP